MPWKTETIGEGKEAKEVIVKGINGNPLYITEDKEEIEVSRDEYVKKVASLIEGEKKWRDKHNEVEKGFVTFREKYKNIKNPEEAFNAIETVKNLGNKKLIDAGEVEKVKAEIKKVFEDENTTLKQKIAEKDEILQKALSEKDNIIYKLTVSNKFASSPFIKEKTVYTPTKMEKIYGDHFKVEEGKPVGYLKDEKIYSKKEPGELASFEEALSIIIDADPEKDEILKGTQQSGSGSQGSENATGGKVYKTTADFGSDAEKSAFISKNGLPAYQKIVDASRK